VTTTFRQVLPERLMSLFRSGGINEDLIFAVLDVDRWQSLTGVSLDDLASALRAASAALELPERATAEYVGRDEIAVVLPVESVKDTQDLVVRIDEIRRRVSELVSETLGCPVTLTAGVAAYPMHNDSPIDLVTAARNALELGKRDGRDRTRASERVARTMKSSYYDALQLARLRRLSRQTGRTEADILREGLERVLDYYDE
jgi:GGDEF domain-containing protein